MIISPMSVKRSVIITIICSWGLMLSADEDVMTDLRRIMGNIKSEIEVKASIKKGSAKIPPRKSETWTFMAGMRKVQVRYSRYMNIPPYFEGRHSSLSADMGIGFDGGYFGNWYRGNAIRLIINGEDIFAQRMADTVEVMEGEENGQLRFTWKLKQNSSVTMTIVVPQDGHAIYMDIALSLPEIEVRSLQIKLNCYPGGYKPAYKQPSHRWVVTEFDEKDVPVEMKKTTPVIELKSGQDWVFYADKLQSAGSLGLLINNQDNPSGKIFMSYYGQRTELNYPVQTRQIRLAFYAFNLENQSARSMFLKNLEQERKVLKTLQLRLKK